MMAKTMTAALALAFAGSQFIGNKNLMERTLGSQLELPKQVWTRLNVLWIAKRIYPTLC